MSSNGTIGLFFLPIGIAMKAVRYRKILKAKLEIHIAVRKCNTYVHARRLATPCHRSKLVSHFLKKNIRMLD